MVSERRLKKQNLGSDSAKQVGNIQMQAQRKMMCMAYGVNAFTPSPCSIQHTVFSPPWMWGIFSLKILFDLVLISTVTAGEPIHELCLGFCLKGVGKLSGSSCKVCRKEVLGSLRQKVTFTQWF